MSLPNAPDAVFLVRAWDVTGPSAHLAGEIDGLRRLDSTLNAQARGRAGELALRRSLDCPVRREHRSGVPGRYVRAGSIISLF